MAVELDPTSLEVRRARGYVLYWTSNFELAANEYRAALSINDKIPNLHLMLGYIYGALGEYDQSIESFNQANALNPPDPIPDYEASRIYYAVGEYARAVQYAEQAVHAGQKAILLMDEAIRLASNGNKERQKLYDWIISKHKKEFVHYILALAFAIKARVGESQAIEQVEKYLNSIPSSYKERYPPETEPDLKWFLNNKIGDGSNQ